MAAEGIRPRDWSANPPYLYPGYRDGVDDLIRTPRADIVARKGSLLVFDCAHALLLNYQMSVGGA